jgi:secreted protein with Ig-like and vWFA domain
MTAGDDTFQLMRIVVSRNNPHTGLHERWEAFLQLAAGVVVALYITERGVGVGYEEERARVCLQKALG